MKTKIILIIVLIFITACTNNQITGRFINQEFEITTYYTPKESDFTKWSTSNIPDLDSSKACKISNKGFYEEVKCQGSGISKDNKICKYDQITNVRDTSQCKPLTSKFSRGITATGTNPTAHRTIAVDPNVIPYNSTIYIEFENNTEWSGCYIAEDTGSMIKGDHIDIYTGTELVYLPKKATISLGCDNKITRIEKPDYTQLPSFFKYIEPDPFDNYNHIYQKMYIINNECISSNNTKQCVENKTKNLKGWYIKGCPDENITFSDNSTIIICVINESETYPYFDYENKKIDYRPSRIRFAWQFG